MDHFRAVDELELGERQDAALVERGLEGEVEAGECLAVGCKSCVRPVFAAHDRWP
jgi:hypothetical protein